MIVAVREELRAVCSRMSAIREDAGGATPCYRGDLACTPVLVASSGMGAQRAAGAAESLLCEPSVRTVLIAGFAAGLAPGLAPGDVVVATSVASAGGGRPLAPDEDLLAAARRAAVGAVGARFGPVVTADTICMDVPAKRETAARFPDAIAVDMECAGAAEVADAAGIPWLALRAVTDGLEDEFPLPFDRWVTPCGEPDRSRVVAAALAHPRCIPGLVRLGRRSALAAGNLAAFVEATVRAMRGETH